MEVERRLKPYWYITYALISAYLIIWGPVAEWNIPMWAAIMFWFGVMEVCSWPFLIGQAIFGE